MLKTESRTSMSSVELHQTTFVNHYDKKMTPALQGTVTRDTFRGSDKNSR